MKRCIPSLLALLLLAGCEGEPAPTAVPTSTPTPAPIAVETVSTLELTMGYGFPTFWLELVRTGEPGELRVDIYKAQGDLKPFQSFTEWSPEYQLTELEAEDVDFDGWTDFHFAVNTGTQGGEYSAYYVWDAETERFVPDPYGLNELSNGSFSEYRREVCSHTESGKKRTYYQYENGGLIWSGEEYLAEEDTSQMYARRRVEVDEDHVFLVELLPREGEEIGGIWVNIYREEEREPAQRFESCAFRLDQAMPVVEDMNFDGYMDFRFVYEYGSLSRWRSQYYIWDAEEEKFVLDPYGLNELPYSEFGGEEQVISSYWVYDAIGGSQGYYRYIDGKLTCVRTLEIGHMLEDGSRLLTVRDLRNGELTEVWRATDPDGGRNDTTYQKALSRWEDLDYPARQEVRVDRSHTFWVEAVDTGTPSYDGTAVAVNVYKRKEDTSPFQTFEETLYKGRPEVSAVDADFDGDVDFSVRLHDYRSFQHSAYYLWDGKQGRFVEDPYGLNDLNWAEFDPESETIEGKNWSMMSGETSYYRYEGDSLVCIRVLTHGFNTETGKMDLLVTDGWNGERMVVYDYAAALDELVEGMVGTEEFFRWQDLDYHGEAK